MQYNIHVPLSHTSHVKYQAQANFFKIFVTIYHSLERD